MSPLERIKAGIQDGDWLRVVAGYNQMTGEDIRPRAVTTQPFFNIKLVEQHLLFALEHLKREYIKQSCGAAPLDDDNSDREPDDKIAAEMAVVPEQDTVPAAKLKRSRVRKPARQPLPAQTKSVVEIQGSVVEADSEKSEAAVDNIEARGQEARAAVRTGRINTADQFRVKNGDPEKDGRKRSKGMPITPGNTNSFKPNRALASKDIEESIRLSKEREGIVKDTRPAPEKFDVECAKCHTKEKVEAIFVPRAADPEDDVPDYVCDRCLSKVRGTLGRHE